jgi:hypothetical protein
MEAVPNTAPLLAIAESFNLIENTKGKWIISFFKN